MQTQSSHHRFENAIIDTTQQFPNAAALTEWDGDAWYEITYSELIEKAKKFKDQLLAHEIKAGERVILLSHNRIVAVIALLGIWMAHATAVLIDPDLPESVLMNQCQIADARFAVVESNIIVLFLEKNIVAWLIAIQKQAVIWHKKNKIVESKTVGQDCDASIATILFTSGTSGEHKGVVLTHQHYLYQTQFFSALSSQTGCLLTVLPLFHVAGLFCGFLQPLLIGVRIVFFAEFRVEALQDAFIQYQPTVLLSVPRLLEVLHRRIYAVVSQSGVFSKIIFHALLFIAYIFNRYLSIHLGKLFFYSLHKKLGGKLKKILCGSAQLSYRLQKQFLTFGFELYCSYGLTETCGPITFTDYRYRWKLGSVGRANEPNTISISEKNEVLYSGFALMSGYFRDPVSTQNAIQNGVFHTQDLGKCDQFDNLYIIGRKREVIIFSDGKKAMPEQIEKQYADVAGVKELAVFGVNRHPNMMAVLAFVPTDVADIKNITQIIFKKSSTLKSPFHISDVMAVDIIPRSSTLKIKRHVLSNQYKQKKF